MDTSQVIRNRLEEGLQQHQRGAFEAAEQIYQGVLDDDPGNADACHFLGLIAHHRQNFKAAVTLIQQAIAGDRARPTFHFNLGAAQLALGEAEAARDSYQEAAALKPDWPEAHFNAGSLAGQMNDAEHALPALTRAIALRENYAEAHASLAAVLNMLERPNDAKVCAEKAVRLDPELAEAWTNLGNAEDKLGELSAAETAHRKSIQVNPAYASGYYNLGNTFADMWRQAEAIRYFRKALDIAPGFENAQDNLLLNLLYDPDATEASLFQESRACEKQLSLPAAQAHHTNGREPDRPLRIGYVSPDFRTHSCAYFLETLFTHHDRTQFVILAYANVSQPDKTSSRFQELVDHWRDISGISDEMAVKLIRADEIDILVDLAGRSKNHRLGIFRRKPAPIQMSWLGYPGTTGVPAIDYRITDAAADPIGPADDHHTETLLRLDGGFHCYTPPDPSPEPGPGPVNQNGYVTFGSFNNLAKVSEHTISVWSEILRQTPQSVLLLKSLLLSNQKTQETILNVFNAEGIDANRIRLIGWIPQSETPLAAYHQIDIALDTFPYNGTTTTFEAIWMGVPVVTVTGNRHAGRVGASLLGALELNDFVAKTPADYIAACTTLARDTGKLNSLRSGLRLRLQKSTLMNGAVFAGKMENALRQTWQDWCARPANASL
ncbi:MAG: hypothetical protein CBD27_08290 [Rhodospirillaceae bacterium TMED167]|nr:hypothetical protein [Rhodospirillaceae bacterium]OUW26107.1 MAG: hypothetical protein CBD27_08290 [Rhodospirillaceae bacterium TMED167]